jgi:hypothetical protein
MVPLANTTQILLLPKSATYISPVNDIATAHGL